MNADGQFEADVLIEDGLIKSIGKDLKSVSSSDAIIIDARGKFVMPGGIDPHTHLSMPFMAQETCDDFFSGHAAALAGGTTYHIDFALPVEGDLLKGYERWRAKAAHNALMDYSFHMGVTSWSDKVGDQMMKLAEDHGINSFKFFMAYKGALMVTDEELIQGLMKCRDIGALAQVHAENGDAVAEGQKRIFNEGVTGPEGHALSRPSILESEATSRAVRLSEYVNTPLYVVHVMSGDAAEEISRAKMRGARVIGETVASALALDESVLWNSNFTMAAQYVMSPPIRSSRDREQIRHALAGGALQLVGTDHAPFNSTQKALGKDDFRIIPNGVHGLEERMHIVWQEMVVSGLISLTNFVRITSTEAAKIFNIYPKKGVIAVGSDADVIVLDPEVEHVLSASSHHSRIDMNIYEGRKMKGKVTTTISQGRLVWHNGKLEIPEKGSGRFIPLPVGGPLFEGLQKKDVVQKLRHGSVPVKRIEEQSDLSIARGKDEL